MRCISPNLRGTVAVALMAASGCADVHRPDKTQQPSAGKLAISFTPMYSAFDGVHTFQVPAIVDLDDRADSMDDPVEVDSVTWSVDRAFVSSAPFAVIPGAVLLTTRRAGTTTVRVEAKTHSGLLLRGASELTISAATAEDWAAGDQRYNEGSMFHVDRLLPQASPSANGLPPAVLGISSTACANCHNDTGSIALEYTPLQTAGDSDDALIEIFSRGVMPTTGFKSALLDSAPADRRTSFFVAFHTWDLAPEVARGLVYKLRSLPVRQHEEVDAQRLHPAAAASQDPQ